MKVGQMLGYIDNRLPADLREGLSVLQQHAYPMPFARVRETVEAELGSRGAELIARMDQSPVSAASIGQVHRSALPDGTSVAVKVRYPEIEEAVANDFGPAAIGGTLASFFYPDASFGTFVREARARFLEECDYGREARFQRRFADLYADHPILTVPAVHDAYSSRGVLTTTWVDGVHLDEFLAGKPEQADLDFAGTALFELYVGTLFRHGIYNCDPHPGNYLFCADGRVAVVDFGCACELDPAVVEKLAALTRAVQEDDAELLHGALVDLGIVKAGQSYDRWTARRLTRSFYGPMLRDETLALDPNAGAKMRELSRANLKQLTLPGEFLFLLRVRFGLAAVLARMGARANWYRLDRDCVEEVEARAAASPEAGGRAPDAAATPSAAGRRRATPPRRSAVPRGPALFDVVLLEPGDRAIQVIRVVREATGLGVREARERVEGGDPVVSRATDRKSADELSRKIREAGGRVEVRPSAAGGQQLS
jgi:predicted unusual protein kinase regulating ubiquinone biosynthesis (AarF/ABC1/UbiB family)